MSDDAGLRDLRQVVADLEARLATGDLDPALVRAAIVAFSHLGRGEAVIRLLRRYLHRPLAIEEEAWARGQLVDQLALLDRCGEAVDAQLDFMAWAREALPSDRLLRIMSDSRMALCWVAVGRHEEWLRIFSDLLDRTVPTEGNRLDRVYLLRTAAIIMAELSMHSEALRLARAVRLVADEDRGWERAFWAWTESRVIQLYAYHASGDRETLRRAAVALTALLDQQYELLQTGGEAMADAVTLRALYENAAVPVYRAAEYELAIPLLEHAVELGSTAPQVHESLTRARLIVSARRPTPPDQPPPARPPSTE
jgi:hypothetical protein